MLNHLIVARLVGGVRRDGLSGLLRSRWRKRLVRSLTGGKLGLEIGGPSAIFAANNILPAYGCAGRVDNSNFSHETLWEGAIEEGLSFRYDPLRPPGRQYVAEATDLGAISSETYDFILSSHALEHVANPIKALHEWSRILKPGGAFIIVLPHYAGTFDHRRPVTPLAHMIDDHRRDVGEDDLTHLEEILEKHEHGQSEAGFDHEAFRRWSLDNFKNRAFHHHVFDTPAVVALLDHAGIQLLTVEESPPINIIAIGRKLPARARKDNRRFLDGRAFRIRIRPPDGDRA